MGTADEDSDVRRGLNISAEFPADDGARDLVRGRGEHLDDDVPMVTPTVHRAEQAADAADAHMSVGKMDMMSRAAAKMTESAAACELIGAEIWTFARTAIELFGASVSKFANKFTSFSIDSSLIIDLTAKRDDGQFQDLGTREEQEREEQLQQEHQTELLIGSAPCISFCTLLHTSKQGTKQQIEKVQDEEGQYTQACIKAYRRQLSMGRHFLHEHPVHASCDVRQSRSHGNQELGSRRWESRATSCLEQTQVQRWELSTGVASERRATLTRCGAVCG